MTNDKNNLEPLKNEEIQKEREFMEFQLFLLSCSFRERMILTVILLNELTKEIFLRLKKALVVW